MRFTNFMVAGLAARAAAATLDGFKYERLDKNEAAVLVVDLQDGLFGLVRDFEPTPFKAQLLAHAGLANAFDLPMVITTSTENGPNGRTIYEILDTNPNATIVQRPGEVNAWDNPEFQAAIRATGKTQFIIGGIMTDVCTAFLALSLREAGYSVWANVEASGTISNLVRDVSNDRMTAAGVHVVSFFAIFGELMRDWTLVPGAKELFPFLDRIWPAQGHAARHHAQAVLNGTVFPGQDLLPGVPELIDEIDPK